VWHGVLNAADYGVPQHRRRLIIVASHVPFDPPEATHGPGTDTPYVSCGAALNAVVIGGGRNPQSKSVAHTRTYRELTHEPSVTITAEMVRNRGPFTLDGGRNSKANPRQERVVGSDEPAPSIGTRGNQVIRRPEGTRCLQPDECAILQGFPPTHPWQGSTKRSLYRQVGNAVPPALAEAIGRAIIRSNPS
jgi:DNA (cytosine-5)-methyltransferase 1